MVLHLDQYSVKLVEPSSQDSRCEKQFGNQTLASLKSVILVATHKRILWNGNFDQNSNPQ